MSAAAGTLPPHECQRRVQALVAERVRTAQMLVELAEAANVRPAPWIAPVRVTPRLLGLPTGVAACVFDLDGVLTDSGALHAAVWASVFDEFLLRFSEKSGWPFVPFEVADYRAYLEGRPRLEGVHAFLDSRGIRLPDGRPFDCAGAESAHGLARRKHEALARQLAGRGTTAAHGARRFLEAAGHAAVGRAVVSASTSTASMLELAGLAMLVDELVDGELIEHAGLRSRPAPDVVLAACDQLGVCPSDTVAFTTSPAGVAAGKTAGVMVVGVGDGAQRELLEGFGADRVVSSLREMLDGSLLRS